MHLVQMNIVFLFRFYCWATFTSPMKFYVDDSFTCRAKRKMMKMKRKMEKMEFKEIQKSIGKSLLSK